MDNKSQFCGKYVSFVGRLISMNRQEAIERIIAKGGEVTSSPKKCTSFLVVGNGGVPLQRDGKIISNMKRAKSLKLDHQKLEFISEIRFLEILELHDKVEDLQRLFTTSQLSRILAIPTREIRTWMRRKLINPVKVFRRLAWFDFREVIAAHTLASLTKSGISLTLISRSIKELSQWLPGIELMVNRLQTIEGFHSIGVRLKNGKFADTKGQLLLDFHREQFRVEAGSRITELGKGILNDLNDAETYPRDNKTLTIYDFSSRTPEELFNQGLLAEDSFQWELAIKFYEEAIDCGCDNAEVYFNLGNVLYETDHKKEAVKRYLQAIQIDKEYVEALNNLGNALAATGFFEEAVEAYKKAIHIEPGYADAHSNLSEILLCLGQYVQARFHWNAYLEIDPNSSESLRIRDLLRTLPLSEK